MIKKYLGFHLLELLIVMSIIAIIVSLSLPSYSHYTVTAKRYEAITKLSQLALAMEHYYLSHQTYQNASLAFLHIPELIANKQYRLLIERATKNDYLIVAKALHEQARKDHLCESLTLNANGEKGSRGGAVSDICWGNLSS